MPVEQNSPVDPDQVIIPPFQPTNSNPETYNPSQQDNNDSFEGYSDFAQGILSAIPENDRGTVGKYIKTWDGNVTKQFQRIHDQYRPYSELGDLEDVQTAVYYANLLQQDPIQYVRTIIQACQEAGMSFDGFGNQNEEEDPGEQQGGIPPEYIQRMSQLENMMGTMYGQFQQDYTSRQEAAAIDAFDRFLDSMHSRHGDFDDDWVSLQIERGVDPEKAVTAFKQRFPGYGSPAHRPAPTLLSGNGTIRQDQVNPSKMSDKERKDYVGQILRANLE